MFRWASTRPRWVAGVRLLVACLAVIAASCTPAARPAVPSPAGTPTAAATPAATGPTPTVAPTNVQQTAPDEGLVICSFEDDIAIWQGYDQATETQVAQGANAPSGYIPVARYHAKYTDRWCRPTAGFEPSAEQVKEGRRSGKWANTVENNRLVAIDIPHDWSGHKYLTFWAYSAAATQAGIEVVAYSESAETAEDDYYRREVVVDWTGWQRFEIPLQEFGAIRTPAGWHRVDYIKIASTGWSHTPHPGTLLYFDAMRLSNVRSAASMDIKLPEQPSHPNLLLSASELAEVREKVKAHAWAANAYQSLAANAFVWSTRTVTLPETGGGYYHAGGEDYAITRTHYDLANAARDLALAYQLSGERRYLTKAREILLAYADRYLTYEVHDKGGRTGDKASAGGRATAQGINEAQWAIPLAWAYDLVYHDLAPEERERIERRVLRPVAELLMANNEGRHNHQAWYNAGIGVIGFALNDAEYVWHALRKKDSGFDYQMKKSVTADGMWYEGSMHYQFYVLQALAPLAEAAYRAGIDLYGEPAYKALLDFPLLYADARLRLPAINDGREVNLRDADRSRYYEAAYNRLRDPRYAYFLQGSERSSLEALLYGVAELPAPPPRPWRSLDLGSSGLAVLRAGQGSGLQAVLNYMGYQGGHSHPDQLGLVLHGLGRTLAPDAGSIKYEDAAQDGWYKQSLAHNLLTVDGRTQERAAVGRLEAFVGGAHLQVARATVDRAYPGIVLARTLLLADAYLVDVTQAQSDAEHTYDWAYHNYGTLSSPLAFTPAQGLGSANGYEYLQNARLAHAEGDWEAHWLMAADQQVRLRMAGAPGTEVWAAEGLVAATTGDETSPEAVPLVIARRHGRSTRYVALVEPYGRAPAIGQLTRLAASVDGRPAAPDAVVAWRIERGTQADTLIVADLPGAVRAGDLTLRGGLALVSHAGRDLQWLYLGGGTALEGPGWSVALESLATEPDLAGLGACVERVAPDRWAVRGAGGTSAVLAAQGLLSGEIEAWKLGDEGQRIAPVALLECREDAFRLFLQPHGAYEIVVRAP